MMAQLASILYEMGTSTWWGARLCKMGWVFATAKVRRLTGSPPRERNGSATSLVEPMSLGAEHRGGRRFPSPARAPDPQRWRGYVRIMDFQTPSCGLTWAPKKTLHSGGQWSKLET